MRNARDVETDTVVAAPRRSGRRPQPEQAQEAAEPTGNTAANVGADSNARQVGEAEEEPEETHVLPRTPGGYRQTRGLQSSAVRQEERSKIGHETLT